MNARLRDRLGSTWWAPGTLLVAVVITLAAGFCVFDADHEGDTNHAVQVDLCLGMLVASLGGLLPARLPWSGWAAPYRLLAVPVPLLHTPAPPPKSNPLF